MKKTKENSWFEIIPINAIGKDMVNGEGKEVLIVQIEEMHCISEDKISLMICELVLK